MKSIPTAILAVCFSEFFFSDTAELRDPVFAAAVFESDSSDPINLMDLVQTVAADVPVEPPLVRDHVAKLFVSAVLFRAGAKLDQVTGLFTGVDLRNLSLEYAALLDGDKLNGWFLSALERYEPLAKELIDSISSELPA